MNEARESSISLHLLHRTGTAFGIVLLCLYTPWLVRQQPEKRWVEWSPVWDMPHPFTFHPNAPFCPEGHASVFIIAIEIVALVMVSIWIDRRLEGGGTVDIDDYSPYHRQHPRRPHSRPRT